MNADSHLETGALSTHDRWSWAKAVVLLLVTLVVYIPAIGADYVWNDDDLTNSFVLQPGGLYKAWFTAEASNYWPVVWTSYWFENLLWGLKPLGYHLVNVLIHGASALVIWRVLIRLRVPAAWVAALIFAVHPVNVESVAWITQRKNTLSLFFFMAALLLYLRYDAGGRRREYVLGVVSFALAMLSKGAAATLPVVLLICVWWLRGHVTRRDVLRSLPFFFVTAVMSAVEIWFQYVRAIGDEVVRNDVFLARLAGAGWVVWFYLYKALWPAHLCFVYPRWEIDPVSWTSYVPLAALAALFLVFWHYRRGWGRPALFALGCYVVTLGPVLGFLNIYFMRYSLVADHYQYTSIICVIAVVVSIGRHALTWAERKLNVPSYAPLAAILLLLAALSWQQAGAYENTETLWRDTLAKNPASWMPQYNLARWLLEQGRLEDALTEYQLALEVVPDSEKVHYDLGITLERLGRYTEAIGHYRQAIESDPEHVKAHYNLAIVYGRQRKLGDAIHHYRRAIQIQPDFLEARVNLGNALVMNGQLDEAIHEYREALSLDPGLDVAIDALHATLALKSQQEAAESPKAEPD